MNNEMANAIADEIITMYETHGGAEYAGEPVTQLEHMVQAGELAREQGYDGEVILAAFLHDIGHICVSENTANGMGGYGIRDHEEVGADFLTDKDFSQRLVKLVGSHVEAKRYLTYKDVDYYNRLSDASKTTLKYQGGPMDEDEAERFEQDPMFQTIINMRLWDEEAKRRGLEMTPLEYFKSLIVEHLLNQPEKMTGQTSPTMN